MDHTKADPLPDQGCELCSDQGPLLLQSRCHMTAPLQVTLDGDMMIVSCYVPSCRREVARFHVQRTMTKQ